MSKQQLFHAITLCAATATNTLDFEPFASASGPSSLRGGTTEPRQPRGVRFLQTRPRCAVALKELCVEGGSDAGSDMEIKLDIRHAGRDGASPRGEWGAFTSGKFRDVPKNGCADVTGTVTPIGNDAAVGIRIEENDGGTFFNENEHFAWTFYDVCARASSSGQLSYRTSDGTFIFKMEMIESDNAVLSCEESNDLSPRAKNGDASSASGQCASGCCSKNIFGADSCRNAAWFRTCVPGYMFRRGSTAQCGEGSLDGQFNIMSYNLYLVAYASDSPFSIDDRADHLADWFAAGTINADVIVIQENWLFQKEIESGMIKAGYCHYVYDHRGHVGSGMAVYSRHPIEEHEFRSFDSVCEGVQCLADKGVIYTKIRKDGSPPIHVLGTHFQASPDDHGVRLGQSALMRNFASERVSDTSEPVFFAGDFNEDRIGDADEYEAILDSLDARDDIEIGGDPYSYDANTNDLINPSSPLASGRRQALDFIFYDERQCRAYPDSEASSCRYLKPTGADGNDLSDHYPIFCKMKL